MSDISRAQLNQWWEFQRFNAEPPEEGPRSWNKVGRKQKREHRAIRKVARRLTNKAEKEREDFMKELEEM